MNLDAAVQTFLAESRELLERMEQALLELETRPADSDLVNEIFRAAHTIKGSAGLFGFDPIVEFMHEVETLLDRLRDRHLEVTPACIALLLKCADHAGAILDPVVAGAQIEATTQTQGADLLAAIARLDQGRLASASASSTAHPAPTAIEPPAGLREHWHISLRYGLDVLRNGMDPYAQLQYLASLGEIVHLVTLTDTMPAAADMDPEACYLGFELAFRSAADKQEIEAAFDFVREDAQIRILPPASRVAEYIALINELPEDPMRLGEILVRCGAVTRSELALGLEQQIAEQAQSEEAISRPIGEVLTRAGAVHASVVAAALDKQQAREHRQDEGRLIRVNAEKLDQLIDLVGELVIAGSATQTVARRGGDLDLLESTRVLLQLVEDLRNSVLTLRMVQIGSTFQRFTRVVRDVSRELGKDIDLEINGADTELDKSMVERIGDPLMHLVRNAMDHGIEPAEVRAACGKPARATLGLNAFHDSGSIVIEVADDGGGLKRDKILRKAIERGIVAEGQALSDKEIDHLVFAPGFSTADRVSNLSGRGVGMDVVKRSIEALRGTVEIESRPGLGTTVRIRLPLTLAIIDGFLVGVGKARYVIPLDTMVECLECPPPMRRAAHSRGYVDLRGEVLPVLEIRDLFAIEGDRGRRANIVVVRFGTMKAGMIVDELIGESQTVIKPLGTMFGSLTGISGSTILGSGEVALILDVPGLIQVAASPDRERTIGEPAPQAAQAAS
ncbi:MAG TPA: chemotaxis protein CheA [Gammaproteobacteria bacterium]|nr:chemotaxis protein CheA [Gammaproteobacteria bacterium]